jgi:microcystin-dependent protein
MAFFGQIALFPYGQAPQGWLPCAGQVMPINRNQPLFALLGTAYGGDGETTFALPDLRGRVPISFSQNFPLAQQGGEEAHALLVAELPNHNHALLADATSTNTGNVPSSSAVLGRSSGQVVPNGPGFSANLYAAGLPDAVLNSAAIANSGGGQPHENRMPSLALNYCICVQGNFPSR